MIVLMKKSAAVAFGVVIGILIFFRLFNLQQTFVLFGDSARDLLELHEWEQTKLPPLLGPHTSALSFNQSAWYFYWLMPFYLLSAQSIYTANIAVLAYYFLWFGLGLYSIKKGWFTVTEVLVITILITIHPELIKQLRQVWNPSFVLPLTLAIGLLLTKIHWPTITKKSLLLVTFCLALAVGLSYSIVPFALVVCVYVTYQLWKQHPQKKRQLSLFVIFLLLSTFMVNLGTIAFELRYQFLLTKNLGNQQVLQVSTDQAEKWQQLILAVFQNHWIWLIFIVCLSFSLLLLKNNKIQTTQLEKSLSLLFLTMGTTLLFPFAVHGHYIFGILALLIVVIVMMPILLQLIMVVSFGVVVVSWLLTSNLFATNSPTTAEKRSCLQRVCEQNSTPIYVVGNSGSHDHQALEYSYLAKSIDCDAFAVTEISTQQPKTMAVFNQGADFELGKTDFYELNRFANLEYRKTIQCAEKLSVSIFSF
jgi:hypothetical protein